MNLLDEYTYISIHRSEIPLLSKAVQKFIGEYADIEFYPNGLKSGKKFNKVTEFKRLIRELANVRKNHGGKESNVECLVYDQLRELMSRMMLRERRKLNLERIL